MAARGYILQLVKMLEVKLSLTEESRCTRQHRCKYDSALINSNEYMDYILAKHKALSTRKYILKSRLKVKEGFS